MSELRRQPRGPTAEDAASRLERPADAPSDDLRRAESLVHGNPADRRRISRALAVAVVFHAVVLVARVPQFGEPVRIETPIEEAMQVQFLQPPPPKAAPKPAPRPEPKKIPRPDPTPDEPEPVVEPEPEPPPAPPEPTAPPAAEPAQAGPVRVAPGQGPGLIKRVEPTYPPLMQASRREGVVTLDAVIYKDGTVGEVTVLESPHQLFSDASAEAVRQWRFTPSDQDVILTVTVRFSLR